MGLFKLITRAFIEFYRKIISPLKPPHCRFHPTCSRYALDCLEKYSYFRAIGKIIARIVKCHPFHPGGNDPA